MAPHDPAPCAVRPARCAVRVRGALCAVRFSSEHRGDNRFGWRLDLRM